MNGSFRLEGGGGVLLSVKEKHEAGEVSAGAHTHAPSCPRFAVCVRFIFEVAVLRTPEGLTALRLLSRGKWLSVYGCGVV